MASTAVTCPSRRIRIRRRAIVYGFSAAALAAYLLTIWFDWAPWLRGWQSYPVGWSWEYIRKWPPQERYIAPLAITSLGAVLLWYWDRRGSRGSRARTALCLAALVIVAYALQLSAMGLKEANLNRSLLDRVLSNSFTGFFTAATRVQAPGEFFNDWQPILSRCRHCQTHPSGAAAFFWLAIRGVQALPAPMVEGWGGSVRQTLGERVPRVDSATLLAALVSAHAMLLLGAASLVPYAFVARRIAGRLSAAPLVAGLLAAQPGLILMTPQMDQVIVPITGAALLLALLGLQARSTAGALISGTGAGLLMAVGLFITFGLTVWLAFLFCLLGAFAIGLRVLSAEAMPSVTQRAVRAGATSLGLAIGCVTPYLVLAAFTAYDVREVARVALSANASFVSTVQGGKVWLFHGTLDTAQFAGLPLALASLAVAFAAAGTSRVVLVPAGLSTLLARVNVYSVAFWGIVLLTFGAGQIKGEGGRTLLFLMPLAALAIASARRGPSNRLSSWEWALIASQLAVTLTIAARWHTP